MLKSRSAIGECGLRTTIHYESVTFAVLEKYAAVARGFGGSGEFEKASNEKRRAQGSLLMLAEERQENKWLKIVNKAR